MISITFPISIGDSYGELGWNTVNLALKVSSFKPWHAFVLFTLSGISNSFLNFGETLSSSLILSYFFYKLYQGSGGFCLRNWEDKIS